MSLVQALLLAAVVVGLSAGQILFKLAATASSSSALGGWAVAGVPLGGTLLFALAVYALATALWLAVLRTAPLSWAYPFTALAYVVVPLLAHAWLGEAIGWRTLAGGALIVMGVALSSRGA